MRNDRPRFLWQTRASVDLPLEGIQLLPVIRGMSPFHCYLLGHEDKGMMAKFCLNNNSAWHGFTSAWAKSDVCCCSGEPDF